MPHLTFGSLVALLFEILGTGLGFLAELFTTAMFFNWKGARTKSHEK